MRLSKIETNVEATPAIATQTYGIREEDLGHLLETQRRYMYKDPIYACIREIAANARDAHREAGCPDRPIRIYLPTVLSKQVEIEDTGTGISPRRMSGYALNYGASTKRRTNKLQGAYGLGMKSPLAVNNSFTIITRYNGTEYHYVSYVDESRCGRADLIREFQTDEPNGTRIIIPIKDQDINAFARAAIKATKFWDPKYGTGSRPALFNLPAGLSYPDHKEPVIEDKDWVLYSLEKKSSYFDPNQTLVIVDGIPYAPDVQELDLNDDDRVWVSSLLKKNLHIYFQTGKLSLAASRDELHYDERTRNAIYRKLVQVYRAIRKLGLKKVSDQPNLRDAEIFWHNFRDVVPGLTQKCNPVWGDIPLQGDSRRATVEDNISIRTFFKDKTRRRRVYGFKISENKSRVLTLSEYLIPVIDDLKSHRGLKSRVELFFEENHNVNAISFIKFGNENTRKRWEDEEGIKHMDLGLASSVLPVTVDSEKSITRKRRSDIDVWLFDTSYYGNKDSENNLRPVNVYKDPDEEMLFVEIKSKRDRDYKTWNKINISEDTLKGISDIFPGIKIYVVPSNRINSLGVSWRHLEAGIIDDLIELMSEYNREYIKGVARAIFKRLDNTFGEFTSRQLTHTLREIVNDNWLEQGHLLERYYQASEDLVKEKNKVEKSNIAWYYFSDLMPEDDQKEWKHPVELMYEELRKTYPLLMCLKNNTEATESIVEYIKAIDSYKK